MFIETAFPPALIMLGGALLLPLISAHYRPFFCLFIPLLTLGFIWVMPSGQHLALDFMGYRLLPCKVDQLSRVFGLIFALISAIGCLYAFHIRETGQNAAALLYAAGALGVAFAGDFITLFIFWELMAVSSTYLVWASRNSESMRAGLRYLLVHLSGGGLLLAGILAHVQESGGIVIEQIASPGSLAAWLILAGVGLNAAMIPLHAWLPDAYPRATITGAVFLSALTTKTAVYALLRMFPGWEILLYMGVLMTIYGIVFAFLANDIREILAYHIISQVGYMVAGAGIGTQLAINGSTAHAFSHILYKALLFMGAGAVIQSTGKRKLTELGGLAKKQPLVLWLYMIGAFSISGFPFFNGFVSKSMVVAAAGEEHYNIAMLLMLLASVGTFLSVGLKLPYFTWFGRDRGLSPAPLPRNMPLAMGAAAFFCLWHGIMPGMLYALLPYPVTFKPYTYPHMVETSQILIFTFLAFWKVRQQAAGEAGITLDADWFYRRPAGWMEQTFLPSVEAAFDRVETFVADKARKLALLSRNPLAVIDHSRSKSYFSPDIYRPHLQALIISVLFSFILFSLWSFLTGR